MRQNKRLKSKERKYGTKKYLSVIGAVAVFALALYFILGGGDLSTPEVSEIKIGKTKPIAPKVVRIFIDNSSSMEGYVLDDSMQYIYALSDLMNIYPGTVTTTINDAVEMNSSTMLTNKLAKHEIQYHGQSLLDSDLKKIIDWLEADQKKSSNRMAVFITDGIMSGTDSQIDNLSEYNKLHKTDLMYAIADKLKGKNMGASIYRLLSDFKGKYYCYNNYHSNKDIHTHRSYYAIVIGKSEQVADFKMKIKSAMDNSKFNFRPINSIHFIEKNALNQDVSIQGDDKIFMEIDSKTNNVRLDEKKVKDYIDIRISSDALENYELDLDTVARKTTVKINNRKFNAANISYDKLSHVISIKIPVSELKEATTKVKISIPYFVPSWIEKESVDDDLYMYNGMPDTRTFLLENFVNGVLRGVRGGNNTELYSKEIVICNR